MNVTPEGDSGGTRVSVLRCMTTTRLAGTQPLTLAQALDLISTDKREMPKAWREGETLKSACRLQAEYGFAAPTLTAERLATIWESSRG